MCLLATRRGSDWLRPWMRPGYLIRPGRERDFSLEGMLGGASTSLSNEGPVIDHYPLAGTSASLPAWMRLASAANAQRRTTSADPALTQVQQQSAASMPADTDLKRPVKASHLRQRASTTFLPIVHTEEVARRPTRLGRRPVFRSCSGRSGKPTKDAHLRPSANGEVKPKISNIRAGRQRLRPTTPRSTRTALTTGRGTAAVVQVLCHVDDQ
jgi:hypothetical protein